jgi:hypothetical protein
MRLLVIFGVVGGAFASTASAMSVEAQHAAARAAAFAPHGVHGPSVHFVDRTAADRAPVWVTQDSTPGLRINDRLTLSTIAERVTAGAILGPQDVARLETRSFDITYRRSWPSAFSVALGRYDLDLSPHAGVGAGGAGRSVEAGLMARFGKNLEDSVSRRLGVREPGVFGTQGRWYLFAASSGQAVGLNLMRSDGDWRRAGVTQDSADALIGANHAGFGWRKGPMQASLGYVHREVKIRQGLEGLMGAGDRKDDRVALSFSIKPN